MGALRGAGDSRSCAQPVCYERDGGGCGCRSGSVQTYRRRHCRAVTSRSGECEGAAKRQCPTTGTFVPIFRFSVRQSNEKGAAARGLAGPTPHAYGCREAAADRDGNSRGGRSAGARQRGELVEARRQHRRPRPLDRQMRRRARPRASLGVERNRRHRRPAHLPARGRLVRAGRTGRGRAIESQFATQASSNALWRRLHWYGMAPRAELMTSATSTWIGKATTHECSSSLLCRQSPPCMW